MKILLPIDDSSCSATAVDAVIRQFDPKATEICVVHAVERSGSVPPYLAFAEGPTAAADVLESYAGERTRQEAIAMRTVERLRSAGFTATLDVRVGNARDVILECAADWRPELIVIGSHGRTGLPRLLLGSVAQGVSRAASCSVQVVRPSTSAH